VRYLLTAFFLLAPLSSAGHGINGHVHVTGWAIERLPPGPARDFFADESVRDAAMIGAAFPDSGYAVNDHYGELAHWPPFVNAYVEWFRENIAPPFDTVEKRRHAAFVIGLACHGLQDELFDSLFLHQIREHDGAGQDEADPGTDAFLFVDGHLRFQPPLYFPGEAIVQVMERAHGHAVDAATVGEGMERVKFLVIDNFSALGPSLDARYRPLLPWSSEHYLDPDIPGSLGAEVPATAAFIEAVFRRLHDDFPVSALAVHQWPTLRRRLRSLEPDTVDAWSTLVFGAGVVLGSLTTDTVELVGPGGERAPVRVTGQRWGGSADSATRLVSVRPQERLLPDSEYTLRLLPGVRLVDGRTLDAAWETTIRTPCDPACAPDAPIDAGAPVLLYDGGLPDAAAPDAATPDAETPDAVTPDAATPDAATPDAATPDAVTPDASAPERSAASDGCRTIPGAPHGGWGLLALLLPLARLRRGR
jgi:hypothetical protein